MLKKILSKNNFKNKLFVRFLSINPKNPYINQKYDEDENLDSIIDELKYDNDEEIEEIKRLDKVSKEHSLVN